MLLLHTINNALAFVFALGLNSMLLHFVFTNRSKEIQIYSRILALACSVDMIFSAVTFISEPIYSQLGEYSMLLNNGLISRYLKMGFFFCMAFDFFLYFSLSMNAVQFGYRYIILKLGPHAITSFRILLMCVLSAIAPAGLIVLIFLQHVELHDFEVHDRNGSLRHSIAVAMHDKEAHICAAARLSFRWTLTLLYIMAMCVAIYAIIVVCGYKIYNFPKNRYGDLAKSQRSVDQQIFRTLIIQATLPMVLILLAMVVLFMSYFQGSSPIEITSHLMEPLAWLSALNPLITLTTVSVYRRRVLDLISKKKKTAPIITSEAPTPTPTQN